MPTSGQLPQRREEDDTAQSTRPIGAFLPRASKDASHSSCWDAGRHGRHPAPPARQCTGVAVNLFARPILGVIFGAFIICAETCLHFERAATTNHRAALAPMAVAGYRTVLRKVCAAFRNSGTIVAARDETTRPCMSTYPCGSGSTTW